MADRLRKMIDTLSKKDINNFRVFIQREKILKNRKDLALFETLLTGNKIPETSVGTPNYHASRKRLMKKLTEFILLKQQEEDETGITDISGKMAFARYLFNHNADEMAWVILHKAEKQAEKKEQFNLLHAVYTMMVEYSHKEHAPDLKEVLRKRSRNKERADEDERAAIASGLIRQQLGKKRKSGDTTNIEKMIDEILTRYNLDNISLLRPKLIYNILSITRHNIFAKKEFHSFAPYVIRQYKRVVHGKGFSSHNHHYKLGLLYMISHILYRNRKFTEASKYLGQMFVSMDEYNGNQKKQFYFRYLLLKAAICCYNGQVKESITILEDGLSNGSTHFPRLEKPNALLNLAIYYFLDGKGREAVRAALRIDHTDHWLEKHLGKEWVFKKNLMEAIALYDDGDTTVSAGRIRSIERNYRMLLKQPLYSRAKSYLEFLKRLLHDPLIIRQKEFFEGAKQTLVVVPEEQEDLQAITFYSWLKSKMLQKDFYETLLETVKI